LEQRRNSLVTNLALMVGGMIFAGVMVVIFLTLFPQFIPRPGMGKVVYQVKHGDIFFNHPQWMAIPENYEEILSEHYIGYDADGFRRAERQADTYQILAVGDSFTEAANVPRPWTDVLAEKSGMTVRNLGYRGFGPVEEAEVVRQFGSESGAAYIVVGFFEGNDLANAVSSQGEVINMPRDITAEEREMIAVDFEEYPERDERYPMRINLGGVEQDIAFFEWYVWGLNGTPGAYRRSSNLALTAQSWDTMRESAGEKCLIFVYFPSKPHIYVPYLTHDSQTRLLNNAHLQQAADGQPLNGIQQETTFDELVGRLGNLRDEVRRRVERQGILFFDVTPVLQAAAARGEMVYYAYDTHWNQRGHDLVGEAIAE
jgi:hypothetical protein